jgi:hypothetical protein
LIGCVGREAILGIWRITGIFLYGVVSCFAYSGVSASRGGPQDELSGLIRSTTELQAVFSDAQVVAISALRAESVVELNRGRHAIVMYRGKNRTPALGTSFCHSALSRPEREQWARTLVDLAGGDQLLADEIAIALPSVSVRFIKVEDRELKIPAAFEATVTVCHVPEGGWVISMPKAPDQEAVLAARYAIAKRMFAAQRSDEAQRYFRSVLNQPSFYYDAILFLVALLHSTNPSLADGLRSRYVDLNKANDPSALLAYLTHLRSIGSQDEIGTTLNRCQQIGGSCR